MSDQPDGTDQQLFSGQVVQMLVADIRASLESQLTTERVSQAFQEAAKRLAEPLELPQIGLPESVRDMALERQISALILDMRKW